MKIVFSLLLIFLTLVGWAQHPHNMPGMSDSSMKSMTMKKTSAKKTPARRNMRMNMSRREKQVMSDTTKPGMKMNMRKNMLMDQMNDTMKHGMNMERMNMSHSFSRNLPMSRDGSGTSWMPDASPRYAYMIMKEKTMIMLHGNIFLRYTNNDIFSNASRVG